MPSQPQLRDPERLQDVDILEAGRQTCASLVTERMPLPQNFKSNSKPEYQSNGDKTKDQKAIGKKRDCHVEKEQKDDQPADADGGRLLRRRRRRRRALVDAEMEGERNEGSHEDERYEGLMKMSAMKARMKKSA